MHTQLCNRTIRNQMLNNTVHHFQRRYDNAMSTLKLNTILLLYDVYMICLYFTSLLLSDVGKRQLAQTYIYENPCGFQIIEQARVAANPEQAQPMDTPFANRSGITLPSPRPSSPPARSAAVSQQNVVNPSNMPNFGTLAGMGMLSGTT